MANKLYEEESIRDIAVAIREKNGLTNTYDVSEMGDAVRAITSGDGITPAGSIEITTNGTHNVAEYAEAVVNVPMESEGITPSGTIEITANGNYDVTNYANAVVSVAQSNADSGLPSNMRTGTFTVTEDTQESQIITHGAGVIPTNVLVVADELANPLSLKSKTVGGMKLGRNEAIVFNNTGGVTYASASSITDLTETTFTVNPRTETTYPFSADLTYRWWVWF